MEKCQDNWKLSADQYGATSTGTARAKSLSQQVLGKSQTKVNTVRAMVTDGSHILSCTGNRSGLSHWAVLGGGHKGSHDGSADRMYASKSGQRMCIV